MSRRLFVTAQFASSVLCTYVEKKNTHTLIFFCRLTLGIKEIFISRLTAADLFSMVNKKITHTLRVPHWRYPVSRVKQTHTQTTRNVICGCLCVSMAQTHNCQGIESRKQRQMVTVRPQSHLMLIVTMRPKRHVLI